MVVVVAVVVVCVVCASVTGVLIVDVVVADVCVHALLGVAVGGGVAIIVVGVIMVANVLDVFEVLLWCVVLPLLLM